jgi:hypothetical protein
LPYFSNIDFFCEKLKIETFSMEDHARPPRRNPPAIGFHGRVRERIELNGSSASCRGLVHDPASRGFGASIPFNGTLSLGSCTLGVIIPAGLAQVIGRFRNSAKPLKIHQLFLNGLGDGIEGN